MVRTLVERHVGDQTQTQHIRLEVYIKQSRYPNTHIAPKKAQAHVHRTKDTVHASPTQAEYMRRDTILTIKRYGERAGTAARAGRAGSRTFLVASR